MSRNEEVSSIKIGRGASQSDPLSPLLFNLVVDRMIEIISEDVGYCSYGGRERSVLELR